MNFLTERCCALEQEYKQQKFSVFVDGKSGHAQVHRNRCKLCREDKNPPEDLEEPCRIFARIRLPREQADSLGNS